MKCPRCQQENPRGQKFCGDCGTPLQAVGGSAQPARSYGALQRSLTEALEHQTATTEILRVISASQTDVKPVFDTILSSALRLMRASAGVLTRITGDDLDLAAFASTDTAGYATVKSAFPLSIHSPGAHAKAILDRTPINIATSNAPWRMR